MKKTRLDIVPAIQWHEGMMLSSQHFQQNDLRLHQILVYRLKLIEPYNYGLIHLEYDKVLFSEGILKITELECLLPDGEIIDYSSSYPNASSIELNLSELKEDLSKETYIWCGLFKWYKDRSPLEKSSPRFKVLPGDQVPDNEDQSSVITIPRLEPHLKLYTDQKLNTEMSSFPILKVVYRNSKFEVLNYQPPGFFIKKESTIYKEMVKIATRIREKAKQITQKYSEELGTFEAINTRNILEILQQTLPIIELSVNDNPDHPYKLYRTFGIIIGKLSMLNPQKVCPIIKLYDHNNLSDTFLNIFKIINEYLDTISDFYMLNPFIKNETIFTYTLKMMKEMKSIYVGVKFPKNTIFKERYIWCENAVIVSEDNLEDAINKRILGAKRKIVDNKDYPNGLYCYEDVLLKIENDEKFIINFQNLIIFNPSDSQEALPISIYYCDKNFDEED